MPARHRGLFCARAVTSLNAHVARSSGCLQLHLFILLSHLIHFILGLRCLALCASELILCFLHLIAFLLRHFHGELILLLGLLLFATEGPLFLLFFQSLHLGLCLLRSGFKANHLCGDSANQISTAAVAILSPGCLSFESFQLPFRGRRRTRSRGLMRHRLIRRRLGHRCVVGKATIRCGRHWCGCWSDRVRGDGSRDRTIAKTGGIVEAATHRRHGWLMRRGDASHGPASHEI
mmetsp:Transcript_32297/g.78200  ORF Transcript_32297/g.78200 Transcript_32297/m.78200 type:complete len:234 (+) Transcript_32297:345-1046(+)